MIQEKSLVQENPSRKIEIEKIEDVRSNKRNFIIERAKALLEGIEGTMPESRELQEAVMTSFRTSKMQEYGDEKLSSGDISGEEAEEINEYINILLFSIFRFNPKLVFVIDVLLINVLVFF